MWVLTNPKKERRRGRVRLINATTFRTPMRRSLGEKRGEISEAQIARIAALHAAFEDGEYSRVFDREDFGYRKLVVERPLRLSFQASPERIACLVAESAVIGLAASRKNDPAARATEEAAGREQQAANRRVLASLPATLFEDRAAFERELDPAAASAGVKLTTPLRKAILSALSERDETAEVCRDRDANPEPGPELRDTENVPLKEDVVAFFEREAKPYVPGTWLNTTVRDHRDGEVGRVGYELDFNRSFYTTSRHAHWRRSRRRSRRWSGRSLRCCGRWRDSSHAQRQALTR